LPTGKLYTVLIFENKRDQSKIRPFSVITNRDEVTKKDDENSETDSYEQSTISLSRLEHRLNISDLQKLNEVYEVI
jgi:hypothetical protein